MLFSKNARPKVIPSDKTAMEISEEAQRRLSTRRKSSIALEKYLFGAKKSVKKLGKNQVLPK